MQIKTQFHLVINRTISADSCFCRNTLDGSGLIDCMEHGVHHRIDVVRTSQTEPRQYLVSSRHTYESSLLGLLPRFGKQKGHRPLLRLFRNSFWSSRRFRPRSYFRCERDAGRDVGLPRFTIRLWIIWKPGRFMLWPAPAAQCCRRDLRRKEE